MRYFIYLVFAAVVANTASAQVIPVLKPVEKKTQKTSTAPQQKTVKKNITDGYVENYHWKNNSYDEIYTGYIKNGLPNGKGAIYDINKVIQYEGVFEKGYLKSGTVYYSNGKKSREGNFDTEGRLTGYGKKWERNNNNDEEGNYINGELAGFGKVNYPGGAQVRYVNETTGAQLVLIYDAGTVYEGDFKKGVFDGSGILKNSLKGYECRGSFSYGDFLEGEIHFSDGSKYFGKMSAFRNSTSTGNQGTYYFANGDIYQGEFYGKKMHGKGIYTWKNGSKYSGTFNSNQINGHGELNGGFKKDGVLLPPYVGTFKTLANGRINFDEDGTKKHTTFSRPDGTPPYPLKIPNIGYP